MTPAQSKINLDCWQQVGREIAACEVSNGFQPRLAASLEPLRGRLRAADVTIRTAAREFVLAEPSPVREWLLDNEALLRLHLRDAREAFAGKLRPVFPRLLSGSRQGESQVL